MKLKAILLGLLVSIAGLSHAQTVEIEENDQAINGVTRHGQQLTVQLDPKFVEKYWKDHLGSEAGKVKQSKGIMVVEGAVISAISEKPMRLVSTVSSNSKGSSVWWSLDLGAEAVTDEESKAAKDFLAAFATKLYREDVLQQINKAENILRDTKKEQERVLKQADDIKGGIEKNKKRKQEIEADLARNAEDLVQLEQNVELNKKQQELSRLRVLEMEKALEAVRAKLGEIK